ncbi:MAG: RDD family protein [Edaphobacter sp.]
MSSAQLDIQPLDEAPEESEAAPTPFALKQQVAERLAAHRARHSNSAQQSAVPVAQIPAQPAAAKPRAARIAATVAERYAHSQSYRAFLAAEAERAIRQAEAAEAAAEVAARNAQAIADAQNQLLAELDQWELSPPEPIASTLSSFAGGGGSASPSPLSTQVSSAGLTVRLYDGPGYAIPEPFSGPFHPRYPQDQQNQFDEDERLALEDEIAFRQSPIFDEPAEPTVGIPANLIEFPRQLVASRRARPRIAEGPLRDEAGLAHDPAQLRIFEVEPAQISTEPVAESAFTEWSSILLGALPAYATADASPYDATRVPFSPALTPQTATLDLRLMAGIVDGCIIFAAFLSFAATFALALARLPGAPAIGTLTLQTATIGTGGTLALLTLLYQVLFFTFSDATPGMRYARIGLCTFGDENPTRAAMRRRIFAAVLSACPLGIGFIWAWLDDDRLGWHDRISRMYQRSY